MRQGKGISRRSNLLLPLAVGLIAAAALLLGVLQFRWVSQASEAEAARLRQSLRTSAGRVLDSTGEELRVLQALLFLSAEELAAEDWGRFAAAVAFWRANSRFPELLKEVYLAARPARQGQARYHRYDESSEAFLEASEPQALRGLFTAGRENDPRASTKQLLQGGVLLSPLPGAGPEEQTAVLALMIDPKVVWAGVLSHYMEQYLEGYPFRVVEAATAEVLAQSAGRAEDSATDPPPRRSPDLAVGLAGPPLFWSRITDGEQRLERTADEPPNVLQQYLQQDPTVRFWLQRSSEAMTPMLRRWLDDGQPQPAPLRLEIFYPGAPIEALVAARRAVNLSVSGAVLLLLLASTGLLLRLYGRTTQLRAMEQEFVASMSHELRTPLAVLQSTSENLKAGLVTNAGRMAKYSEVIYRETRRLAGMVEAVLLYSGIENRRPRSFTPVRTDLDRLMADVTSALEQSAHEAGCAIRVCAPQRMGTVLSDPLSLRLIMENLLLNAIRHGRPGEIRLIVEVERRGAERRLRLAVEDDGPGIPAREQRRVFEPFVRGEASLRAQRPGSGLGLHLVRRVARILGGSVRLDSPYRDARGRAHGGCRFSVELPAAAVGRDGENADAEDPADRG